MATKFSPENLRERQAELKAEIKKIQAKTVPLRAERDKFVQESSARIAQMDKRLKKEEAPLVDLQNEAGVIAKALGGQALSIRREE
jgi:hypothetical protein